MMTRALTDTGRLTGLLAGVGLLAGAGLLAPLMAAGLTTDRWAVNALAFVSALLIAFQPGAGTAGAATEKRQRGRLYQALVLLAVASGAAGIGLGHDKAGAFAGVCLLTLFLVRFCRLSGQSAAGVLICLGLTIPLPSHMEAALGPWLAEAEAGLFTGLAQAMGLPIYRLGAQVVSGPVAVTINSACSGAMLIWPALLGFTVAATVRPGPAGQRAAIVAMALPFAFCVNLLRLGVLLVLNFNAPDDVVLAFHDFLGWAIMPLVWVAPILLLAPGLAEGLTIRPRQAVPAALMLAAVSTSAGLQSHMRPAPGADMPTTGLAMPAYVAGWTGHAMAMPDDERRILAADYAVRRLYSGLADDRDVLVTAIYHRDAAQADQHDSYKCYRALGWRVDGPPASRIAPGMWMRTLTVRDHARAQAVTEFILDDAALPAAYRGGKFRLQIVERLSVPEAVRRETAFTFIRAVDAIWGEAS
ncbi:exosortase-associated EpsI family protein [Eilatimonas milleporae]|uniref:Exosortase/archaeosortase family protein n=1 Tax=Eilatimonas milleporae TaxID=911205 RepID=A0A3M0CUR8_9PROT|nr:exosortase-associated EpsI family protein [Eilatimonas milleporae]RMB12270.1 exosortase/archaeosortase family protein [Eilatimonas milleporae]